MGQPTTLTPPYDKRESVLSQWQSQSKLHVSAASTASGCFKSGGSSTSCRNPRAPDKRTSLSTQAGFLEEADWLLRSRRCHSLAAASTKVERASRVRGSQGVPRGHPHPPRPPRAPRHVTRRAPGSRAGGLGGGGRAGRPSRARGELARPCGSEPAGPRREAAAAEGAALRPRVRVTWCEAGSHLATNTNREERPPRERQRPFPCRLRRPQPAARRPPARRRPRPATGAPRLPPAVVSARRRRGPRPGAGPPPTPRRPRRACKSQSQSAGCRHGPSLPLSRPLPPGASAS